MARVGQTTEELQEERWRMESRRQRAKQMWVIRAIEPPTIERVWALRFTREMVGTGAVAEDLSLRATIYERHIVADVLPCTDGKHVMFEFFPPIERMAVRPERMSGVVNALQRSGYHCYCYDGRGKEYEF